MSDASPNAPAAITRQYFTEKYARLGFGSHSVLGYSVAGEETVVQVPELSVCFDAGRAPQWSLTSDILCLSHGHMDHVAGLAYFASQRFFQGMKPPTFLVPMDLASAIDDMLKSFRKVERQATPYRILPMMSGDFHEVRRDFGIRSFATHHGQSSLGYSLVSIRTKLKDEYLALSQPDIINLKKQGVEITRRTEVPLVAYLGDTSKGPVFEHTDVVNCHTLLTECTFYDADHLAKAKAGKHLHAEDFAKIVPNLRCQHIVIGHVSRRTGIKRAKSILKKLVGPAEMQRIHFLMDFENATESSTPDVLQPPAE